MRKILFLLLLCVPLGLSAEQNDLHIIETKVAERVPFAQPFALQYVLAHNPDGQVSLDEQSIPSDFALTKTHILPNSPGTVTVDLTAIPFTLGKSTFTVTFLLKENGKTTASLQADPLFVEITPIDSGDKTLREIRGPQLLPDGWPWIAALLLLIIAFLLYRYSKKKASHRKLAIQEVQDNRPPNVIALSKIDALLNSGLWETAQYKIFYISLTDILREYLWKRFKMDVSAETSQELLKHIREIHDMKRFIGSLKEFLASGDLVKFARFTPPENIRNRDVQILRELITETSPREIITPNEEVKR